MTKEKNIEDYIQDIILKHRYRNVPRTPEVLENFNKVMSPRSVMTNSIKERLKEIQMVHLKSNYHIQRIADEALLISQHDFLKKSFTDENWASIRIDLRVQNAEITEFYITAAIFRDKLNETAVAKRIQDQFDELVFLARVFEAKDFVNPGSQEPFGTFFDGHGKLKKMQSPPFNYSERQLLDFHTTIRRAFA